MEVVLIAFAYLLGAVPFAVIVSRALGRPDPRGYGSGNPGATNVARGGGRAAAIITLAADAGKGAAAAALGAHFFGPTLAALAGAAAVVGHAFPVFLRFKGGKGVAAALGAFAAWQPLILAAALATWAVAFHLWRVSSLASLSAMAAAAVLFPAWAARTATDDSRTIAAAALFVAALVAVRHRQNIADLLRGKERTFKKNSPTPPRPK